MDRGRHQSALMAEMRFLES